jgi:hypothetical protein
MESALNRPVWFALLYWRPPVRDGAALALRFSPDIAPFGAAADDSPEAFRRLGHVPSRDGRVALVSLDSLRLYPGLDVVREAPIIQMIADTGTPGPSARLTRRLVRATCRRCCVSPSRPVAAHLARAA